MLQFEYPWLFLLLLAPPAIWWLSPAYKEQRDALQVPYLQRLAGLTRQPPSKSAVVLGRPRQLAVLLPVWWALIVVALARPVWLGDPIEKDEPTRDMMLLVDLSGSMDTQDFTDPQGRRATRLDAVKAVLGEFVERRKSDRLGLIVFGSQPYLQAPFTRDHRVVRELLSETRTGLAGVQTAIGDGIGLALKHFESSKARRRIGVLLTDGNDTSSTVPPKKAAEIAARRGVMIYTVAVGNPDAAADDKVDLETLQTISRETGGRSFRAEDRRQLDEIYRTLDSLEPEKARTVSYRPRYPLFQWPAGTVLVTLLAYHLLAAGGSRVRSALGRRAQAEDVA
jgi:Ca-activated chloride channel homolog